MIHVRYCRCSLHLIKYSRSNVHPESTNLHLYIRTTMYRSFLIKEKYTRKTYSFIEPVTMSTAFFNKTSTKTAVTLLLVNIFKQKDYRTFSKVYHFKYENIFSIKSYSFWEKNIQKSLASLVSSKIVITSIFGMNKTNNIF